MRRLVPIWIGLAVIGWTSAQDNVQNFSNNVLNVDGALDVSPNSNPLSDTSPAALAAPKKKWKKKKPAKKINKSYKASKDGKSKWTVGNGDKRDADGDRNLGGGLILQPRRSGGRGNKNNARNSDSDEIQGSTVKGAGVDSPKGVKFIQQGPNHIGIKWNDDPSLEKYVVSLKPAGQTVQKSIVENRRNTIKYEGLLSANVYWVTITGVKKNGENTSPVTIKVFTSPSPPKDVRMTDFTDDHTQISWENPNSHRSNCYAVARLARAPKQIRVQKVNQKEASLKTQKMPPGVSYDILIYYVYNKRRSDTYQYRITTKPQAVDAMNIDKIELVDDGLANVQISWKWPSGWWGSVKVDYSPPTPTAQKQSPFYITNRRIPVRMGKQKRRLPANSTIIQGLQQGIVYTFGITLTKGPLEGGATIVTQGVPETDEFRNVLEPTQLTCRVPLDLNPQELQIRKNVIGEPSLTIMWKHPKKKEPEEGYKVVVVPFAESTSHLPKIYYVPADAEETELILTGNDYDPFVEYSISVVARHNPESYDHDKPNGPEFTARLFTGQYVKVGQDRQEYVMPDSCCKTTLYNSQEKVCCGGTLHDIISGYQCCGWAIYDKSQYQCCQLQAEEPVVKTLEEGCGFGKVLVGSAKKNKRYGYNRRKNKSSRGKKRGSSGNRTGLGGKGGTGSRTGLGGAKGKPAKTKPSGGGRGNRG